MPSNRGEARKQLTDRLSEHKALSGVPGSELEWLAAHGEFRTYEPGGIVAAKSEPILDMVVMLTGRIAVHFGHGTGRIHKMESSGGHLSGLLPYSRMNAPIGDAVAVEPTELLALHRDHFPGLINECPVITAKLVHSMIDRARVAAAATWQDEKMMSLGRLAAGFAHQLNNPASAAARSAKQIGVALSAVGESAHALGRMNLNEAQRAQVDALLHHCVHADSDGGLTALDRADREDEIVDWLESRGIDASCATSLAAGNVRVSELETLCRALPADAVGPALRWIAAASSAQSLATNVEQASGRINELIAGIKRFTSMDRAAVAAPMNIAEGLADTVTVLAGRAAAKSVTVHLEIAADLPMVTSHAADLNQVWLNLLENAIDAAPTRGDVRICATSGPNAVEVRVIDDGPGIPPDIEARMFDPFFTTKGVGEGIGFGLDIVRRIVRMYDGDIAVDTRPGRTEFRVHFPATATARK